jgi:subtilisin family serine protease
MTAAQPQDPYRQWALLTAYRDIVVDASGRVAVAIECDGTVAALQQCIADDSLTGVRLSALYAGGGVIDPAKISFCTAWVERGQLPALAARVKRLTLGMAVDEQASVPALQSEHSGAQRVVGVIDDFIAYGHRRFSDADGRSRVRHVWSQDGTRPPGTGPANWSALGQAGYGWELSTRDLSRDALEATYPAVLPRATHGTHVADLAAGAEPDAASPPDIVAVHLPRRGVADTSGSALKVQVLDALHYIIQRAGPQAAVVVNLSYGTMAGPHDGSTILERAIDQLVQLRAGKLTVVLPAGNSYEARCHAAFRLGAKKKCQILNWNVLPDDATPSYLEVWLPEGAAQHVSVTVRDPNGRSSAACAVNSIWPAPDVGPAQTDFAVIFLDKVAQAERGTMILIAIAATRPGRDSGLSAPAGVWQVELTHQGTAELGEIHAWIERDDTLRGRPARGRQSYFLDEHYKRWGLRPEPPPDNAQAYVQRQGSFNTIATGGEPIVVGAYVEKGGRVAPYSGGGPTRGAAPRGTTLLASGEDSATQHGLLAAATRGVGKVRMNGTSVAAPQVTRAIVELLSADPGLSRAQLVEQLRQRVLPAKKGQPGPDDPRLGFGRLPRR